MHILVGTSGWSYKEWKGSFYPSELPADDMLRHYATKLPTVEINNSFYRIPREKVLMEWAAQVPPEFRFVLKASRRITHINRLTDADDSLGYFLQTVNVLGDKLGPTLFQCPPSLKLDLPPLSSSATTPGSPMRSTTHCGATTSPWWPWTRTKGRRRLSPRLPGAISGSGGLFTPPTSSASGQTGSGASRGRRRTFSSSTTRRAGRGRTPP
jgi:Protein of unknown function DUF72